MGISFVVTIQLLEESLIVEMNIEQIIALQQFQWCDAARPKTHDKNKDRLTSLHSCPIRHWPRPFAAAYRQKARKAAELSQYRHTIYFHVNGGRAGRFQGLGLSSLTGSFAKTPIRPVIHVILA
jgi:hypothetical protein